MTTTTTLGDVLRDIGEAAVRLSEALDEYAAELRNLRSGRGRPLSGVTVTGQLGYNVLAAASDLLDATSGEPDWFVNCLERALRATRSLRTHGISPHNVFLEITYSNEWRELEGGVASARSIAREAKDLLRRKPGVRVLDSLEDMQDELHSFGHEQLGDTEPEIKHVLVRIFRETLRAGAAHGLGDYDDIDETAERLADEVFNTPIRVS